MSYKSSDERHPGENEDLPSVDPSDRAYLRKVRDGMSVSTDFLDDGIRKEWANSLNRFHSEHPGGSKYHTKPYAHRSKIFRPKTRSLGRRAEAKAATALFSNSDLINVEGQNKGDPAQAEAARYRKALLQYRLEHNVPWFVSCIGARQDTFNYGVCISLQSWRYEVDQTKEVIPEIDPETGQPVLDEEGYELGSEQVISERIVKDEPYLDLIPPENVRFDPNSDWRDPFGTSPTLTIMLPMYAGKVMERMKKPNPVTGQPEWREYSLSEILASMQQDDTSEVIRQARNGRRRQDPMDTHQHDENSMVWVYLNIVREEGRDLAFYSLGSQRMLTDPVPVEELLPLGRDSLTFGFSVIETHRPYPVGGNRLAAPLQSEINDVANQRMDNVKLAMNKRYILRRGSQVDQAALMRHVPGGGIMAGDVDGDVRVLEYPDVTSSSYQEHDRLSNELDELTGNFSGGSVQSNRALNETVGGMSMLQGDASEVAELELRTFVETWVEPVLRKFDRLIAMFETDETIKQVAAANSEVALMYGTSDELDHMLDHEMVVSVNVGMGNTNPMQKLQRFNTILGAAAAIPEIAQRMNPEEIGKELFALGGFNDVTRFFRTEEQMQEIQAQMAEQQPQDSSLQVAQLRAETESANQQLRAEVERYKADMGFEAAMAKVAADENIKLTELYERIGFDRDKMQSERQIKAVVEGNRTREMRLRQTTGAGI